MVSHSLLPYLPHSFGILSLPLSLAISLSCDLTFFLSESPLGPLVWFVSLSLSLIHYFRFPPALSYFLFPSSHACSLSLSLFSDFITPPFRIRQFRHSCSLSSYFSLSNSALHQNLHTISLTPSRLHTIPFFHFFSLKSSLPLPHNLCTSFLEITSLAFFQPIFSLSFSLSLSLNFILCLSLISSRTLLRLSRTHSLSSKLSRFLCFFCSSAKSLSLSHPLLSILLVYLFLPFLLCCSLSIFPSFDSTYVM